MKIHELVELRNKLNELINSEDIFNFQELQKLTTFFNLLGVNFLDDQQKIYPLLTQLFDSQEKAKKQCSTFLSLLDNRINEISKSWLKMGYTLPNGIGCVQLSPEDERTLRETVLNYEIKAVIHGTISKYTKDSYPVLEIGPGDGLWTDFLVAGDPLYLIDRHQEFLNNTMAKFPEAYQKRIRTYKIEHGDLPDSDMSLLPENQFGFIFAWNVFNFFPLDYTTAFLKECFRLLRPGGIMLFSYNNCEYPVAAKYAESGYCSWMPKSLLQNTVLKYNYEIVEFHNQFGWHWAEIKKPGELKSVKVHQSLGEIVRY